MEKERKFKVGDRVSHPKRGNGIVKYVDGDEIPYAVEFKIPVFFGKMPNCKIDHGWWCTEGNLTLIKRKNGK